MMSIVNVNTVDMKMLLRRKKLAKISYGRKCAYYHAGRQCG
jgi:hypothetical protein